LLSVSDKFKSYIAQYDRQFECRATVAGVIYGNDEVVSIEVEDSIAAGEEMELGSVIASKVTISLRTQDAIAENAKIVPEIRMNGSDGYTEWVPPGVFYIDSRSMQNGVWTLTGYDKLITTSQTFESGLVYPISMAAVLAEICGQLGLTLDASVVINPAYTIPWQDVDISIRDMLSYIASAHGACVKLTKTEKLAFIRPSAAVAPSVTIMPSDYVTAAQTNPVKTYTRLQVTYNDDGEYLEAGTGDDDHTLKFYNPFITEGQLAAIYAGLNGFSYMPLSMPWRGNIYSEVGDIASIAKNSSLTWAGCELTWDAADIRWDTVEFVKTIVLRSKITFKGGLKTEWTSPSSSAQKSEFGFVGTVTQKVQKLEKTAVREDREYYGVMVSRANGLVVNHSSGRSKAILNSDKLAFQANGVDKIYFDTLTDKYRINGTLEAVDGVFSGSLNAATGTFAGALSAATGTFAGAFIGSLTANQISGGTLSGVTINVSTDATIGNRLNMGDVGSLQTRSIIFYNSGSVHSAIDFTAGGDLILSNGTGNTLVGGKYITLVAETLLTLRSLTGGTGVYIDGPWLGINPTKLSFFGASGGGQQFCSLLPSGASLDAVRDQLNTITYGLKQLGLFYRFES
jgi:hypothetical protein